MARVVDFRGLKIRGPVLWIVEVDCGLWRWIGGLVEVDWWIGGFPVDFSGFVGGFWLIVGGLVDFQWI